LRNKKLKRLLRNKKLKRLLRNKKLIYKNIINIIINNVNL
jgi:hypothetical protein